MKKRVTKVTKPQRYHLRGHANHFPRANLAGDHDLSSTEKIDFDQKKVAWVGEYARAAKVAAQALTDPYEQSILEAMTADSEGRTPSLENYREFRDQYIKAFKEDPTLPQKAHARVLQLREEAQREAQAEAAIKRLDGTHESTTTRPVNVLADAVAPAAGALVPGAVESAAMASGSQGFADLVADRQGPEQSDTALTPERLAIGDAPRQNAQLANYQKLRWDYENALSSDPDRARQLYPQLQAADQSLKNIIPSASYSDRVREITGKGVANQWAHSLAARPADAIGTASFPIAGPAANFLINEGKQGWNAITDGETAPWYSHVAGAGGAGASALLAKHYADMAHDAGYAARGEALMKGRGFFNPKYWAGNVTRNVAGLAAPSAGRAAGGALRTAGRVFTRANLLADAAMTAKDAWNTGNRFGTEKGQDDFTDQILAEAGNQRGQPHDGPGKAYMKGLGSAILGNLDRAQVQVGVANMPDDMRADAELNAEAYDANQRVSKETYDRLGKMYSTMGEGDRIRAALQAGVKAQQDVTLSRGAEGDRPGREVSEPVVEGEGLTPQQKAQYQYWAKQLGPQWAKSWAADPKMQEMTKAYSGEVPSFDSPYVRYRSAAPAPAAVAKPVAPAPTPAAPPAAAPKVPAFHPAGILPSSSLSTLIPSVH